MSTDLTIFDEEDEPKEVATALLRSAILAAPRMPDRLEWRYDIARCVYVVRVLDREGDVLASWEVSRDELEDGPCKLPLL